MKKGLTEIIAILDRSGSMGHIRSDAIGGFNTFIDEQRKVPGDALVTTVIFDDVIETLYSGVPIKDVKPLTEKEYVPRNMTALMDAIGKTVNEVGVRLAATKEEDRPEKVMVCILTDGLENASKEFSRSRVKEMIDHQRSKYSWEFSYLGANQDAFAEATSIGISGCYTANYAATGAGTRSALKSMSAFATSYRTK